MAKSVKDRLAGIRRREEKAKQELQRAEQERERLIAPTRGKIQGIFGERLDAFLRANLESLADMRIERSILVEVFDEALLRIKERTSAAGADEAE